MEVIFEAPYQMRGNLLVNFEKLCLMPGNEISFTCASRFLKVPTFVEIVRI